MSDPCAWLMYKITSVIEAGGIAIVPMFTLGTYGIFLLLQAFTLPATSGTKRTLGIIDSMIRRARAGDGLGFYHDDNPIVHIVWDTLSRAPAQAKCQERSVRILLRERLSFLFYRSMRHLAIIRVLAAAAPLLGLLGTVSGLIRTFDAMHRFGFGSSGLLSSGIAEALTATQCGLALAIILLLVGQFQESRIVQLKNDVESRIAALLRLVYVKDSRDG